ncbi:MAG: hypothetical protein HHJ14_01970 [Cellulomonas sp.]|nr:hypothetical protein [Cellulomonas sp.]
MIVQTGYRRVAVGIDCPLARYALHGVRRESLPMLGETVVTVRRAFVEIYRGVSGHPQRALIGATLRPSTTHQLEIEVHVSEPLPSGATTTCPAAFGRDLVPGFPEEFIERVPAALMKEFARPGVISVDRAAYDEADSSVIAFSLAADLLALVLSYSSLPDAEAAIRQRLTEW